MDTYLQRGYIEFKTLAPVFIGSGKELNKKEYIYDRSSGSIYLVDFKKMLEGLQTRHLMDAFESYLMEDAGKGKREQNGRQPENRELIHFLKDNRVPEAVYKTWYLGEEKVGDKSMNLHSAKSIQMFMRDSQNRPYIPGTSFKGMLRTILETRYFLENREEAREVANSIHNAEPAKRNYYLNAEDRDIDVRSVHKLMFDVYKDDRRKTREDSLKDQINDILRGLYVGDSDPIALEDMCLCEKIDLSTKGELKKLNLVRECIRPEVIIRIPITIDTQYCSYTMQDILGAMKSFYTNYVTKFASKFKGAPPTRGNSTTFYLGGGAGYLSKTVTYGILEGEDAVKTTAAIIDQTLPPQVKREHKHYLDVQTGVSPHRLKCTMYNGQLLQMGACCVKRYSDL